jgi:hypothetical protein
MQCAGRWLLLVSRTGKLPEQPARLQELHPEVVIKRSSFFGVERWNHFGPWVGQVDLKINQFVELLARLVHYCWAAIRLSGDLKNKGKRFGDRSGMNTVLFPKGKARRVKVPPQKPPAWRIYRRSRSRRANFSLP